jgi:hypothetical protein
VLVFLTRISLPSKMETMLLVPRRRKGITTIQCVISQKSADLKVYTACGQRLNEIVQYESYVILCGDPSGCVIVTILLIIRPSNTTYDF